MAIDINIRKFKAPTLKEALDKAKRDLGQELVVLHTKSYTHGGFMGMWAKQMCEVTASNNIPVLQRAAKSKAPVQTEAASLSGRSMVERKTRRLHEAYQRNVQGGSAAAEKSATAVLAGSCEAGTADSDGGRAVDALLNRLAPETVDKVQKSNINSLQDDMVAIKSMMTDLLRRNQTVSVSSLPDALQDVYTMLTEQAVSEHLAQGLVKKLNENLSGAMLKNKDKIQHELRKYIAEMIPVEGGITIAEDEARDRPYVIAFIGPTGVGKTTTIAKLATQLHLREGRSVALITQDTYRLAAVEQLRTYSKLLSLPLEVVNTPEEMEDAIRFFGSKDVVLIDTAGRSPGNGMKMNELQLFLDASDADETHLVISVNSNERSIINVKEKFAQFQPNRLVLTKLDEAVTFGLVLNVVHKVSTSLSYVTFGQEVPNDIEACCAEKLTELILGERHLGS